MGNEEKNILDNGEELAELKLQLKVEKARYSMIANLPNCGLWEYEIADKRLNQSRKLDGAWSENNLIIENYRDTVKKWGLIHYEDMPVFEAYCDSMDRGDENFEYELRAITDTKTITWLRYLGTTVYNEKGEPYKVIGKTFDVTREKTEQEEQEKRSTRDFVTYLYNKEATKDHVEKRMKNPETRNENGVLLLLDLDNFKNVNDKWGHLYGDFVLENVGSLLKQCADQEDIIGRVGGDKFLIFCQNVGSFENIKKRVSCMLTKSDKLILKDESHLTYSIGVSLYPRDGRTYESLYKCADIALMQSKMTGKNKYSIYNKFLDYDQIKAGAIVKDQGEDSYNAIIKTINNVEKELFDYSFEAICTEGDFYDAVYSIFQEVGLFFDIDQIFIAERNYANKDVHVKKTWKRDNIISGVTAIEGIYTKFWNVLEKRFKNSDKHIYYRDRSSEDAINRNSYIKAMNIKSVLQFPILDGGELIGVTTFNTFKKTREWTPTEIATLSSITKMLTSYILHLRSKGELEEETLYTGCAMENQKLSYYAIDKETYAIKYYSRYVKEMNPNVKLGDKCYQAFRGKRKPCNFCPAKGLSDEVKSFSSEVYDNEKDTWFSTNASLLQREGMKDECLICWTDVTSFLERVKATDQLTGTLSYDKFRAEALRLLSNKNKHYAMASFGIKDFSHINDESGYEAGDTVLKIVAKRFEQTNTEFERVCRMKGDDFIILMEHDNIEDLKNRFYIWCDALSIFLQDYFPTFSINCMCGMYDIKKGDFSISTLIDKANLARKIAVGITGLRHDVYVLTEDDEKRETEEKLMQRKMKDALQNQEFQVYIQPKIQLDTEKLGGGEALIRWITESGESIPPSKFIPLAERSGYITSIDHFVYETVFRKMSMWLKEGKKVPIISINASKFNLFQEDFAAYLYQLTEKYEIPTNLVEVEIMETIFSHNLERLIEIITKLKEMGFWVSMDDFGTGYSSLNLMKVLPIDAIKIDGSFFLGNAMDERNCAVISSVLHLAKSLNLKVISEGIETIEQVNFIKQERCNYAQGFFYYRPMPMNEFESVMDEKN